MDELRVDDDEAVEIVSPTQFLPKVGANDEELPRHIQIKCFRLERTWVCVSDLVG